jgi:TrmH family RNA methyltransferase
MPSRLKTISIVLVRPESPGNVGSVARIIRNFGLGELRIVGNPAHRQPEARRLAHRSLRVLDGARISDDLESALSGAEWIIGTSGRNRRGSAPAKGIREAAPRIIEHLDTGPGAIVFGPESDGLSLSDLKRCDEIVGIPQRRDAPALNLAQAVAVVGAELFQAALVPGAQPELPHVPRESVSRIVMRMNRLARHCGLPVRNRPEETLEDLCGIFLTRRFDYHEMAVMELWLAQIEWFVGLERMPIAAAPRVAGEGDKKG